MEQGREPRNKHTQIQLTYSLTKVKKQCNGKNVFWINDAGTTELPHAQKCIWTQVLNQSWSLTQSVTDLNVKWETIKLLEAKDYNKENEMRCHRLIEHNSLF